MQRKSISIPISRRKRRIATQSKISTRFKWIAFLVIFSIILVYFNEYITNFLKNRLIGQDTKFSETDLHHWKDSFEKNFANYYIPDQWIKGLERFEQFTNSDEKEITIQISFAKNFSIHNLIFSILQLSRQNHLKMIESYEILLPCRFGINFACSDGKLIRLNFIEDPDLIWYSGKIAIVIDDFGYKIDESVTIFLNLPFPITFAVIPGTKFAEQIANSAYQAGYDILIHLPMEPLNSKVENDGYTVFTKMSEKQLEEVVIKSIEAVPHAIGVNNHMGSKVTIDSQTMARLMRILKKHNLFFLDSITNRQSVAYSLANQTGIPAFQITTYLDNLEASKSVDQKLEEVIKDLKMTKTAIVIGHDNQNTAAILKKEMFRWRSLGVSFVRLNDLFENR